MKFSGESITSCAEEHMSFLAFSREPVVRAQARYNRKSPGSQPQNAVISALRLYGGGCAEEGRSRSCAQCFRLPGANKIYRRGPRHILSSGIFKPASVRFSLIIVGHYIFAFQSSIPDKRPLFLLSARVS